MSPESLQQLSEVFEAYAAGDPDARQEMFYQLVTKGLHTMEWTDLPLLMTTEQAADTLQVHERTVRRAINAGKIDAKEPTPGTGYRIPRHEVMRFAGLAPDPCEEYREAIQQLLHAIDSLAGERGQHWSKSAHEAVENARSLLDT